MTADFLVLDVETANSNAHSICQIGLVKYEGGQSVDEFSTLIDPEESFFWKNVEVHGIDKIVVRGKPRFVDIADQLREYLEGVICVHHGGGDMKSINDSFGMHDLTLPDCVWLNSTVIVRRSWDQFKTKGYGLPSIAKHLGIHYKAHDALEDARATGKVVMGAIDKTGISIEEWVIKIEAEKNAGDWEVSVSREGNSNGRMFGAVMVFTGLGKQKPLAADSAAKIGCKVHPRITKKTTHLVVADEVSWLTIRAGRKISTKHDLALKYIENGQPIEILSVSEFIDLCNRMG